MSLIDRYVGGDANPGPSSSPQLLANVADQIGVDAEVLEKELSILVCRLFEASPAASGGVEGKQASVSAAVKPTLERAQAKLLSCRALLSRISNEI